MAQIYIPTYGRVDRQPTWDAFPSAMQGVTVLVCRPEEAEAHQERGRRVLVCPARGIAPTRQWIIEQHEGDRLLMFDDDLKFGRRREDEPTKFFPANVDDVGNMLNLLWSAMEEVHVVGLASRSGANRDVTPWRKNQRLWDVMGFRMDTVRKEGFSYRQPFMEDFDLQLQFLTRGYPTAMLNMFTKDDFGSNSDGGCSTYRDEMGQKKAALMLWEEWPDFVKPRKAKGWNGIGERTDVRVAWAKAYKAGLRWRIANGLAPLRDPDWLNESGLV